ncbi:MAG: TolC family outer membrane protein [Caulobacteraceae bacterium]
MGAACGLALGAAGAATARAETLTDAIALAYQTNPTLQAERAQLRATDEVYVQARAGYRPTANVQASGQFQWETLGSRVGCTVFSCPAIDQSANANQFSAQLQLTQPLYTGGRTTAQVRGAEAQVLAERERLRQTEGSVLLGVIQAYVDVRRDQQSLAIRKENVGVLQRQVDETRARFDAGEVTRTDVAQSEAQLAASQSELSTAQAQLAISRSAYAAAVGQSPGDLAPEPPFGTFPATVEQAFDTAEANNPAIGQADYQEQSAAADLAAAKAQRMPQVSASGGFGYSQPVTPWDAALGARAFTAGVTLSQPLFSGGMVSSQIRQAVERQNIARIQIEQARRNAVQTISDSWNQLLAARASITANEEAVRAATVAFDGTRAEQEAGLRTTLEVLSAQQVLRDAQLALVNARADEYVASASVLNVMGLLQVRTLAPELEIEPGGHSLGQLKHAFGYTPLEEPVSALDAVGAPEVRRRPEPLDGPIAVNPQPPAAVSTPGAP